jgi:hypothetical protein
MPLARRCLSGGPPRGSAVWAVAVPVPVRWAPKGVCRISAGVGQGPVCWLCGSEELRGAFGGAGGRSEELPVVPRRAPMPPNPAGPSSRPPRGVVRRSRGPARRAPEGGWSVGPWEGPPWLFRGRAGRVLGVARLAALPLRGGAAVPAASARPSPEGVGLALAPSDAAGCLGQAPSGPFGRWASSFRGRSSACIAGVIASRRVKERLVAPPRRGRRVPLWVGRGRSSVVASADAPPWTSAPPRGVGCPSAALRRFSVRPEGFLERLPCRSAAGADAVCRCSRLPEGRLESLLCRSAAGPTRPDSPR